MTTTLDKAIDLLISAANDIVNANEDTDARLLAYDAIMEAINGLSESEAR